MAIIELVKGRDVENVRKDVIYLKMLELNKSTTPTSQIVIWIGSDVLSKSSILETDPIKLEFDNASNTLIISKKKVNIGPDPYKLTIASKRKGFFSLIVPKKKLKTDLPLIDRPVTASFDIKGESLHIKVGSKAYEKAEDTLLVKKEIKNVNS